MPGLKQQALYYANSTTFLRIQAVIVTGPCRGHDIYYKTKLKICNILVEPGKFWLRVQIAQSAAILSQSRMKEVE